MIGKLIAVGAFLLTLILVLILLGQAAIAGGI